MLSPVVSVVGVRDLGHSLEGPFHLRPALPSPAASGARRVAIGGLLAGYLIALVAGEAAVVFVNPVLVFAIHGSIVAAILLAIAFGVTRSVADHVDPLAGALLVPPLIRLISLTLPLAQLEPIWRYAVAGVPMLAAALLVARAAGLSRVNIGLQWRASLWQLVVIVGSVGLGTVEFAILRPAPLGPLPWFVAGVAPALILGLSTGLPEELIFRGLVQTALRPILGWFTVVYAAAVFAALHVGYRSLTDLAFVFAVGLIYGVAFERSRSIVGVAIGHGVANVVLFFVAPNLALVLPNLNLP